MNEYGYVIFNDQGKVVEKIDENWNLSIPKLLGFDSFIIGKLNRLEKDCAYRIKLLCWGIMGPNDIPRIIKSLAFKK